MKTKLSYYLQATRPKTLIAAIFPLGISYSFLLSQNKMNSQNFAYLAIMLIASMAIQIATNFYNDAYDDLNGFDDNRVGPKRMAASNLLTPKDLIKAAHSLLFFTAIISIPIALRGGPYFCLLGFLSLYLAYGYSAGILPLAQNGLGEIFTFLFFGLFAINGSFYIFTKDFNPELIEVSFIYSFFITLIIMMNNLRDIKTDKEANKKTLATKIGLNNYLGLIIVTTIIPFILCFYYKWYWVLGAIPVYIALIVFSFKQEMKKAFILSCLGLAISSFFIMGNIFWK